MLAEATEPNFWLQWLQIIWLDLLLAGDNAVMIALAVRSLPAREQRLGRIWGTVGAAALRVLFLAIASWILNVPLLKAIGGLVLLWIAWKLLAPPRAADAPDDRPHRPRTGDSLGQAVRIIVVADVSMSIDNVFAVAGAAHGDLRTAALGVAISIPMIVWGSNLLGRLMDAHPWIVWLGGGLLGYVAGSLILDDKRVVEWSGGQAFREPHPLQIVLAVACTVFGWWGHRVRRARERAHLPPAS
jgi:YjbE family integral membrane protein